MMKKQDNADAMPRPLTQKRSKSKLSQALEHAQRVQEEQLSEEDRKADGILENQKMLQEKARE